MEGKDLIDYRAKNGITQKELAEKLKVSVSTVWALEKDKHVGKIAEAKARLLINGSHID